MRFTFFRASVFTIIHTALTNQPFQIFKSNIMQEPHINFYVAFPMLNSDGIPFSTDTHKYVWGHRRVMARTQYEAIDKVYTNLNATCKKCFPKDRNAYTAYTPSEWPGDVHHWAIQQIALCNKFIK